MSTFAEAVRCIDNLEADLRALHEASDNTEELERLRGENERLRKLAIDQADNLDEFSKLAQGYRDAVNTWVPMMERLQAENRKLTVQLATATQALSACAQELWVCQQQIHISEFAEHAEPNG